MTDIDNTFCGGRANYHPGTISSSLLGGIQDGQEDAWARMSLLYAPLVYLWCRKAELQPSDAEDVVQEVLRTILARVDDFDRNSAGGSFRGWLRTITRNKLGDFIRADRRRKEVADERFWLGDLSATIEPKDGLPNEPIQGETTLVFNRVLELIRTKFEEPTWQAFLRVVMDEVPPRKVAEELNLSIESVYQAKSRVLRRIRDELRELGE